jgi:glutamate dehydrogenase (NAD(P)+)
MTAMTQRDVPQVGDYAVSHRRGEHADGGRSADRSDRLSRGTATDATSTERHERADEFGPAKVIEVQEPSIGLRAMLVIDNVACGPAIGGLRMATDVTREECARLARAMTFKNAAAGLAHGGGKSVLWGDPRAPREQKARLIRAFAHALRNETDYIFGPDMGTDETCMAWIKDEIGRAVGLPPELGGIPLDQVGATGWGLFHCAQAALATRGQTLESQRIAIQGFGAVGQFVAQFMAAAGARLVAASDSHGTIVNERGLSVEALRRLKAEGQSVAQYSQGERRGLDAIIDVPCDIWIPSARPDVIREDNVDRLDTRMVLQGANIPCTLAAEALLAKRDILVLPDFIANAGGVICAAMEYAGSTKRSAFDAIAERIRANTEAILARVKQGGVLPRAAAEELSVSRLRAAMATRRFNVM